MNMHAPHALLVLLLASTTLPSMPALANDDDRSRWQRRYLEVLDEEKQLFVGPAVGEHVVVTQRIGGLVRGRVVELGESSVKLSNGATYTADRLVPESAAMLFATAFAPQAARIRIAREKQEFELELWRQADEKRAAEARAAREEAHATREESKRLAKLAEEQRLELLQTEQKRAREEAEKRREAERDRELMSMLLLVGACALYVLPGFCAYGRRHHNRGAIMVLNLLAGWTFIGWVGAMVWAATTVKDTHKKPPPQSD